MSALQYFFNAERLRRGWSVREAAERAQISVSKAYAIVNGDDNVEFETFENIASAFDMTPADLATVIGKGSPEADPQLAHVQALLRQVPDEHLSTIEMILRPFMRVKPHPDRSAKPRRGRINTHSSSDQSGPDNPLATTYRTIGQGLTLSVSRL